MWHQLRGGSGRWALFLTVGAALALGLFIAGYLVGDDSAQVDDLNAEVASLESRLQRGEADLIGAEGDAAGATEEVDTLEEELAALRSLHDESPKPAAHQEYDTDFAWNTAGTVGFLTIRPLDLSKEGSSWVLTVEAKNESQEPKTPFCGDAGAGLGDTEGNAYTGDSVLNESSDSCEELQPGLTGTYRSSFQLPDNAVPAMAVIYGDYEQEEAAMTWDLP